MTRIRGKRARALFAAGVLLALSGCAGGGGERAGRDEEAGLAIAASFRQEDGAALTGGAVRFSFGENSTDQPLDGSGELKVSSLPRSGDVELTVLNRQEQVQGAMSLSFSEGAVIDAATDDSGVGHITVREDTEEVALAFTLKDDGTLQCALRLTQPASDPPREVT